MVSSLPQLFSFSVAPKPFLKWAGGKTQLIKQISQFLPERLNNGSIKKYVEPFIGGGAIFFWLASNYSIKELFLSDVNADLILAYKTIQLNVDDLIKLLLDIENKYLSLNQDQRSEYFYQTREDFNNRRYHINFAKYSSEWVERTAQIIFLNKTCFNGLFRVNSKGDFNVPVGRYKKPSLCNPENLKSVAKILQRTEIVQGDFSKCESFIDHNTFVYFDPPYRPISNTSNFTSYSDQTFDDSEQLRLCTFIKKLHQKGGLLLLSNSDPKNHNIEDDYFEKLYVDYRIERVKASRNINSNSAKRNSINELLIMNY
ncbi:DNA adenine methylase [Rivularia sp. UHCC 0363]|uniref:DNA adenine methylase n=1 Tax=Rivularia sp. UHCC 0363 TaxID=3110244 RepID=UPI002B1F46F5|nr:DNA adenine methylase [Rivularia sp. UHCC 0363]MEA5598137.1 DNA adenine methylase [Rivularia sp. UHCC 0363]